MNHKNNQGHDSWMMWAMMICCIAPLAVLFFTGKAFNWRANWPIIIAVAAMLIAHYWLMGKTCHKKEPPKEEENKT
ncbi:MAG: hypothetical protein Q8O59_03360 [bacterium]|nr:hypothetical protein [bacterium]